MRTPGFLILEDTDGVRHVVRIGAIQLLSDTDCCRDSSAVTVGGRILLVPLPLDRLIAEIDAASGPKVPRH